MKDLDNQYTIHMKFSRRLVFASTLKKLHSSNMADTEIVNILQLTVMLTNVKSPYKSAVSSGAVLENGASDQHIG